MAVRALKVIMLRGGNTGRALIHMMGVLIRRNGDIDTNRGDKYV